MAKEPELDQETLLRAMREMGSRGGKVGGKAKVPKGFAKLTLEQRQAAAKRSAEVRRAKSTKST